MMQSIARRVSRFTDRELVMAFSLAHVEIA
jgi:hypothetical protein